MRMNLGRITFNKLLKFQIYFLFLVETGISILHFPTPIRYLLDLNLILIIILDITKKNGNRYGKSYLIKYISVYICINVVFAVLRGVPFGQIVWAIRNNYSYLVFFYYCIKYFNEEKIDRMMDSVVKFQVLNFALSLYEYFALHLNNDFLGGMFGTSQGCNGLLNSYLVVIVSYTFSKYMYKKCTLKQVTWISLSSIIIALLSELKVFFIEYVIIAFFTIMISRNSNKRILFFISFVFLAFIGVQLLSSFDSSSYEFLQNTDEILQYISRSDFGNNDIRIARFTAIAQINNMFFYNNPFLQLFGFGLGSCEDSETIPFFNSSFADRYRYLGYRNISSSMLYLVTGLIGLSGFLMIFAFIYLICTVNTNIEKLKNKNDFYIVVFTQIMCIMSIFGVWYNSTIRRPISYLTFLSLSQLFVYLKNNRD